MTNKKTKKTKSKKVVVKNNKVQKTKPQKEKNKTQRRIEFIKMLITISMREAESSTGFLKYFFQCFL